MKPVKPMSDEEWNAYLATLDPATRKVARLSLEAADEALDDGFVNEIED